MIRHSNSGSCDKCLELFEHYPFFEKELHTWFVALQIEHPDAHISCAGRGQIDQEVAFQRGASKAHYGQSAHNYNAAIDLFQLQDGTAHFDPKWFGEVVGRNIYRNLCWYGAPYAKFRELPHIELADWKVRVEQGILKLVEPKFI